MENWFINVIKLLCLLVVVYCVVINVESGNCMKLGFGIVFLCLLLIGVCCCVYLLKYCYNK